MTGPAQMTRLRASLAAAAVALCVLTAAGSEAQTIITNETKSTPREMAFETLNMRVEGGVLFAEIAVQPS